MIGIATVLWILLVLGMYERNPTAIVSQILVWLTIAGALVIGFMATRKKN